METITREMTIGDVVNKHPETAPIMLSYGLHCLGCHANPYETIENGCLGHGMEEETINSLIQDINNEISKKKVDTNKIITITTKAASKFNAFMQEEHKENNGIRFSVINTEHDRQYSLEFVDTPKVTETTIKENGIKIFIEKDNMDLVKGTEIDYIDNANGSGFKINNPNNKTGSCGSGCGCSE